MMTAETAIDMEQENGAPDSAGQKEKRRQDAGACYCAHPL
jgi:hypothetical protein